VFFMPLACPAACPGISGERDRAGGLGGRAVWGRPGGVGVRRAVGGFEEVQPFACAVPALRQVHCDVAAAVASDPGSECDQVAALALAENAEASAPAAHSKLCVMAGRASHAALAGRCPEGSSFWPWAALRLRSRTRGRGAGR
jgi:hypothetical protein